MRKRTIILLSLFIFFTYSKAQVRTPAQQLMTNEDSLHTGTGQSKTVISGYGSAFYQRNFNEKTASITLERAVLFVGHQFNSKISVFTELEIENAKVEGGDGGGEVAMEQAYLKFNLNSRQYITAGLFIPRVGILNENHLPVNFNGTERPIVEQLVIPATWRELGIGFYGRTKKINYTISLMNGLNSSAFEHGSGLRDGRFEGRNATANNLAVSAAIQYYLHDFTFQLSGYAGGTNGLSKRGSDSLNLSSGIFGLPVYLGEADIQWAKNGINAKLLGAYISFPDASNINKAYGNNVSNTMYGAYAELAYNFLEHSKKMKGQQLNIFGRYEMLDLNASIPGNAIYDGTEKQQHIILGLSYLPIRNIVIKADVRLLHTGAENPDLVTNPSPVRIPYKQSNQFLNIGIGYSF
ncbi:MAG: porin [Ferruginibacter sp.]